MQYTLAYLPVLGELGTSLVGHRLPCITFGLVTCTKNTHIYTHTLTSVPL